MQIFLVYLKCFQELVRNFIKYCAHLLMQQNIKIVLDDVDAVYKDEDGEHQAEAEPQQDIAVSPAVQGGVQHQVVRGCRQESEH